MALSPITIDDVRDLLAKYREIVALREDHDAERERMGTGTLGDAPRERLSALAFRFPGALRELDSLPLETVRARIELLEGWDAKLSDDRSPLPPESVPTWVRVMASFHRMMRGLLCLKKKYGAAPDDHEPEGLCGDEAFARARVPSMETVRRPPRGRLTDVAFRYLAESERLEVDDVRKLVFGERTKTPPGAGSEGGA